MLTVRAIGIYGDESIFQAALVIRGSDVQNRNGKNCMLEFYDVDQHETHPPVWFGNVYVMNDAGKTVSVYELGGWEFGRREELRKARDEARILNTERIPGANPQADALAASADAKVKTLEEMVAMDAKKT